MQKQRVSLDIFLNALYCGFQEASAFVEIRCIHPERTHACSFWYQLGNDYFYQEAMRRAAGMNRDGYGVHFGPALRASMSREFSQLIYMPALWLEVDCDDDPRKRNHAWDKIMGFELQPSVVVDSGGGWHVYYFLDPSTEREMSSDEERRDMGLYLAGLSQVLGGDEAYANSAASLMRLPSLVNTKANRGKRVRFVYFQPEARYQLTDFAWLKLEKSAPESRGSNRVKDSDSSARFLPERTRQYLAHGAASGQRNQELFAAACQFRDAGFSQSEAEVQLVAAYLRDSLPNEMLSPREDEARKTIASVYRQPARLKISGGKPGS